MTDCFSTENEVLGGTPNPVKCFVVLTAGGVGSRVGSDIPKQFIHVNDKPVIAYTMEAFQRHPSVEGITVACLAGWEQVLEAYARAYGITKLVGIVTGGRTNQESIRNALGALEGVAGSDDLIIIHDGNRALVSQDIISSAIGTALREGSAVTAVPCTEVIARRDLGDETLCHETIRRESLARTQTPHAMRLGKLLALHERARTDGVDSAALPELMVRYGMTVYLTPGDEMNFKITTPSDLEIFRALIEKDR
jgi:2-C-methyl-D-erythritol 4-phosphate cytidylyltransferase